MQSAKSTSSRRISRTILLNAVDRATLVVASSPRAVFVDCCCHSYRLIEQRQEVGAIA